MSAHRLSHLWSFFGGSAARRDGCQPFIGGGRGSFLAPTEAGNSSRTFGLLREFARGVK